VAFCIEGGEMRLKDKEDVLDEIRNASKLGYTKAISTSIVDRLIAAEWCKEDDLLEAYEDFQNSGSDRVIIFFQLPFLVKLPNKWIKIKSEYGNPYVKFKAVDSFEEQQHGRLNNDSYKDIKRTQVLISYQLWGERLQRYPTYLETLMNASEFKSVVLMEWEYSNRSEASRPFTPQTYELDVAKRLLLQTISVLKDFIPIYSVASKDSLSYIPKRLDRFFMMVKTGRIVIREFSESTTSITLTQKPDNYSTNLTALKRYLKQNRRPSIYEIYLLDAARQIEMGAYNLAIVQVVMILDWFANEIIEDHILSRLKKLLGNTPKLCDLIVERLWENKSDKRIRVGTEEKFAKYFPAIGISLTPRLREDLRSLIEQRNRIVHRVQVAQIESSAASHAVDIGLDIVQHCMICLLGKNRDVEDHDI
jgi:hypothetical protein